ncbi:hypothetical protein DDB_G0280645 [Dictyostelium discoideum AX4]|uniref:hypothetical protein n=1 Tax=Dictyostelium discoideum AX4 TaxID=352472 RepID=UPI00004E3DAF|nr:hypothetical protein DDB_G0280645 [Dictyostelium discoideum AX4]EAL67124.1 hypothetical protein DDB_G0280645 [Dictyostelium discoideum AX4]|eukprot:XP_641097.1 hypothetical protein DDB_G0280645 [Dictyostelium discoideum AX4]
MPMCLVVIMRFFFFFLSKMNRHDRMNSILVFFSFKIEKTQHIWCRVVIKKFFNVNL